MGTEEAPSIVKKQTEAGPAPISITDPPVKEGRTVPFTPDWLTPHVAAATQRRAALPVAEQRLFDSYWLRATGAKRPPLSARERDKLISYFVP